MQSERDLSSARHVHTMQSERDLSIARHVHTMQSERDLSIAGMYIQSRQHLHPIPCTAWPTGTCLLRHGSIDGSIDGPSRLAYRAYRDTCLTGCHVLAGNFISPHRGTQEHLASNIPPNHIVASAVHCNACAPSYYPEAACDVLCNATMTCSVFH